MDELEVKSELCAKLDKEISDKKHALANIENDLARKRASLEVENRIDEANIIKKHSIDKEALAKKKSDIIVLREALQREERKLKERTLEIENRELDLIDIENKRKVLLEDRSLFLRYKREIEEELNKAKEIIEESKVKQIEMDHIAEEIATREKRVIDKELEWNNKIGDLELLEREIRNNNFNKEAMNIKEAVCQ